LENCLFSIASKLSQKLQQIPVAWSLLNKPEAEMYKLLIRLFMHLPTEAQLATKTFINKLLRQNDTAGYRKENTLEAALLAFYQLTSFSVNTAIPKCTDKTHTKHIWSHMND
jgi:hypothetical protein